MKNKKINELGILIQALLLISSLYALILTLFMHEFVVFLNIVVGLTLFSIGYNKVTIERKNAIATICFILGFVFLFLGLFH